MEGKGYPSTSKELAIHPGAVSEIADLTRRGFVQQVGGKLFSALDMKPIIDDPRPRPLTVATLTGLADYIAANVDGLDLSKCLVVVDSHEHVSLVTEVHGERNERHTAALAEVDEVERFPFGSFLSHEEFCIQLGSRFVPTDDLAKVLKIVGTINVENGIKTEDDGIKQKVTVKQNIALVEDVVAPTTVLLQPYRTFNDVDQPESQFLFRLRQTREGAAEAALFEADGGKWKDTARQTIKAWLSEKLAILGVTGLRVIA